MTFELYHGDCLDYLRTLADRSIDHTITDPPYEAEAHTKQRRTLGVIVPGGRSIDAKSINFDPISSQLRADVASEIARVTRRWAIVFCQIEAVAHWRAALEIAGMEWVRGGIWRKPDGMPQLTGDRPGMGFESIAIAHRPGRKRWNGGGKHAIWEFSKSSDTPGQKHEHPTMKPIPLMLQLVHDFTDPGETILDPFAGSGSTGVAAIRAGRRFIGCEKDPTYAKLARERLSAESVGLTLEAQRAGQLPLLGGG